MKYLFLFLFLSTQIYSQNFFPLSVNNKYQIWKHNFWWFYSSNGFTDKYFSITVPDSMIFLGETYFEYNGYYYNYNQAEQKLFIYLSGQKKLAADFNSQNGDTVICYMSGIGHPYKSFGQSGDLYEMRYYEETNYASGSVEQRGRRFKFQRDLGLIVDQESYNYISPSFYEEGWETDLLTIAFNLKDTIFSFQIPTIQILGNIPDMRKDQFPFHVAGQYTHPYPALIDTILLYFTVSRNDSLILKQIFPFSRATNNFFINPDTTLLQPGDVCKVMGVLYDTSIFNYIISFPDTGYLQFKILSDPVAVKDEEVQPGKFDLINYPNPFNASTNIRYSLSTPGNVKVKIINSLGETIKEFTERYYQSGIYEINWEARELPSGMYFININFISNINNKESNKTIKTVLLK